MTEKLLVFVFNKFLLSFMILIFLNSYSYSEGTEESVSAVLVGKSRDIIELHFIQNLSRPYNVNSGFYILLKKCEDGNYTEKQLLLKETSYICPSRDNVLVLKLVQSAPITGLITIKYTPKAGKLKRADGQKVREFTCIVENRSGKLSDWENTSERHWLGRDFWGNRLQDWRLRGGRLECIQQGPNKEHRNVHLITREVIKGAGDIHISLRMGVAISPTISEEEKKIWEHILGKRESGEQQIIESSGWSGILIGAGKGKLDYKAASLIHHYSGTGGGMFCVMDMNGNIQFRDNNSEKERNLYRVIPPDLLYKCSLLKRNIWEDIQLDIDILPNNSNKYSVTLSTWNYLNGDFLGSITLKNVDESDILGNIAIVSSSVGPTKGPTFWFRDLRIDGKKIKAHPERGVGPVIGTLYSLSNYVLKLTAQFMPVGHTDSRTAQIEYKKKFSNSWIKGPTAEIITPGYSAHFRIEDWDDSSDYDFRIIYKNKEYPPYTGTIKKDPRDKDEIIIAAFTGYQLLGRPPDDSWGVFGYGSPERYTSDNIWFPHNNMIENIPIHGTDMLFFTGDQVYESGNPTTREDDARFPELDYLYRWYYWYWCFGDLTRKIPAVCMTDDHDVYQGNIWGWSGRRCMTGNNNDGGYQYEAEFVNMVQRTMCQSNPNPFDPTPVLQGITVYYTGFNYGDVSFAILEDRKFKTPPIIVKPKSKDLIWDGKIQDKEFDTRLLDVPQAELLGDRQLYFLKKWGMDWTGAKMKVCITQSIFAGVQTYSDGRMVPDLDSNGWPQTGRNKAIDLLRKANAFVIGGDQHLAFMVRHGIEKFADGVYQFCVPAIANKYRRWFDPYPLGKNGKPGAPSYTGEYLDAFGNKITIDAVANPKVKQKEVERSNFENFGMEKNEGHHITGRQYNTDGYGIVKINKKEQVFKVECWSWDADLENEDEGQFPGWPITISLEDCDGRKPTAYLPDIHITGLSDPVVQVIDESNDEVVYTTRAKNGFYRPGVFKNSSYTLRVGEPGISKGMKVFNNIKPTQTAGNKKIEIVF